MQPLNEPAGSPGWVVKLDRKTGKILGYVPMTESASLHSVEDAGDSQPMTDAGNRTVWFKMRAVRIVQSPTNVQGMQIVSPQVGQRGGEGFGSAGRNGGDRSLAAAGRRG